MVLKKKSNDLQKFFKKKVKLPKINPQSLDLFSTTKKKINSYYTKFKKDRAKEQKKLEKRKLLEKKKELFRQKKHEQQERLNKIKDEKKTDSCSKKIDK